jgi:Uma2 family endonuclease
MDIGLVDDLRDGINVQFAPLTVEQYQQMIRDRILQDSDPIELIQGTLLYKDRRDQTGGIMTHGPRHLKTLNKLVALLSKWVASRQAFLQVQGPVVVSQTSEPEPDCCLIRGTPDEFADEVPSAHHLIAVFEVAYSSLPTDRRTKQRLYASAGIPIYVIVNLQDELVEVHSVPSMEGGQYLSRQTFGASDPVAIELEPGEHISFSGRDLF